MILSEKYEDLSNQNLKDFAFIARPCPGLACLGNQDSGLPTLVFLFPAINPVNEAINDNTHPLQITIQSEPIQMFGSIIAEIIPMMLLSTGTYQILFGSSLTMKKQLQAIKRL